MKALSFLMSALFLLAPALQTVSASPQSNKQPLTIEQARIQVAKVGTGEKARATITTKDSAKVKGYISRVGDDDFVIRDRKTDAATTIRYADVAKVERNSGGHSIARNIFIGVGIGSAVVVIAVIAAIARNER
jgi:hypothetical protein